MIIRIKEIKPLDDFSLLVTFDDNKTVKYNMKDDIDKLPGYDDLVAIPNLWQHVQLDESRTVIYWNDYIDLPSDILYEYGEEIVV
ncbi:MAG: DUF2442 domain-containing protein [Ruminococcaceae bacterium]|nr:DUF2442 domain-containing protein [Oscillospiraceae bacterium]